MTAYVTVLFELPQRIMKGLEDGSMIRRGGVIQWANGEDKGNVVAWLRESGGLRERLGQGAPLPETVAQQLAAVGAQNAAIIGFQALTLASVAIGFAVLNAKLNAMDAKLDAIRRDLSSLREDVAWLDRRHDIDMLARLRAALDTAEWAQETDRRESLVLARTRLLESEHHLDALLSTMVVERRAHRFPQLYATYHVTLALALVGRAHVDAVLDGAGAAANALNDGGARLDAARGRFQEPLRDFNSNARYLLTLPIESKALLHQALVGTAETRDRVLGYASEFSYCQSKGIPHHEWRNLGSDEERPLLLCLEPKTST